MICESTWEGGYGYTPKQVGDMTLDQIFMLMADKKILRGAKKRREMFVGGGSAGLKPDSDGFVKGRAADGTPIKARIGGQSKAARLRAEAEAAKKAEAESAKKRRRRRRRGTT